MPENKVNLPSFLYINSDNQIVVGVHGDSVVTDEWNQFIASKDARIRELEELCIETTNELNKRVDEINILNATLDNLLDPK